MGLDIAEWFEPHDGIGSLERSLRERIAALEAERDEALACLRRCGVAASDLLSNPEGITPQAQHAMDNPLQADQLVNDRIAELECQVAQADAEVARLESLRELEAAAIVNGAAMVERAENRADAAEAKLAAVREAVAEIAGWRHVNCEVGRGIRKVYEAAKEPDSAE